MSKHHKKDTPEKEGETNLPQIDPDESPKLTPYINKGEEPAEPFTPAPFVEPPKPIEQAPPEEPTFTVKFTASQIKALQDVLTGASRVPGVTGATPVHDNDAGASSAISSAIEEQSSDD